jgi:hypothetical protein
LVSWLRVVSHGDRGAFLIGDPVHDEIETLLVQSVRSNNAEVTEAFARGQLQECWASLLNDIIRIGRQWICVG